MVAFLFFANMVARQKTRIMTAIKIITNGTRSPTTIARVLLSRVWGIEVSGIMGTVVVVSTRERGREREERERKRERGRERESKREREGLGKRERERREREREGYEGWKV